MTSRPASHANRLPLPTSRPPPVRQVQRPRSQDAITIHFSALQTEDEEEEELYVLGCPSPLAPRTQDVVTALEASEELFGGDGPLSHSTAHPLTSDLQGSVSAGQASPPQPPSSLSSPARSAVAPASGDGPFLSLVKSLSMEGEAREGVAPAVRHRQLMRNLVKSLSTEPSSQESPPYRLPDLPLFKQFAQSRDSKTAPSSPMTSPDSRSFFKVAEVEARIEDTKRRLSEVIYEPLQLLSKMMGDEGGASAPFRTKALSSSVSELSNMASLNGHQEGKNSNYSIEEEGEEDADDPDEGGPTSGAPSPPSSSSLALDKFSMSVLARQDEEEFCILYSEEGEAEPDGDGGLAEEAIGRRTDTPSWGEEEEELGVPWYTLLFLTTLVYGCFVMPLPSYLGGVLLGVSLGFFVAIGVVWLAGPKRSSRASGHRRALWSAPTLDIQEPGIFKGWMNEIVNYDPETYHATLTYSVFVRLEGSILRLSKPNRNIPRRATFNEPKPDVTYVSQKIYDLTDSKTYLVPSSLARKRVWNKKYPICVELGRQDDFMSKAEGEERPVGERDEDRVPTHREHTLFLFGRTGREKEEWFHRILAASRLKAQGMKASGPSGKSAVLTSHSRSSSRGSLDEVLASQLRPRELVGGARQRSPLDYSAYMASYVVPRPAAPSPAQSPQSSPPASKKLPSSPTTGEEPVAWVNALLGRLFWDFLGESYWTNAVARKIQMKLSKIRLPYFMNELTLTELDMGVGIPRILEASKPSVDHQGLWFDLEVSYSGSFLMTLETKMNLARLGKEGEGLRFGELGKDGYRPRTYCLADSDEESSSAGSSDEEDPPEVTTDKSQLPGAEGYMGVHKPGKIMRFVDKIAKSKYFQKATETEFIKKKMEEVSNTPLLLTVEVQECRGTLAVNIPPPPTDRIWYGFRSPPHLELKARPKLGERVVTLAHVTDWIEKKLEQEFQKIFVMPNMDDVWLPIMHSAMDTRSSSPETEAKKDLEPPEIEGGAARPVKDSLEYC